ncbi:hypothetical protein BAUCODRAFT_315151 [Baudoinia panamericana UAMH 10762]|uniref:Uncharacterized protein n=1 Tax=Baudoinia panamericana (strain UAMH 10762) TaxID=717646 RepID=M2LBB6_BAUPA|nr:uncharacterized protein BAUCODRAFT_315151 [Baudoinia panamericana UAMH 10762]EMC91117.1 hypothetical protein BAUCODRAFT_315151 [Baudoinia panamericana UAMH 10762]
MSAEASKQASTGMASQSHKGRRHSEKKKSDPFLEIPDEIPKLPNQPLPDERDKGRAGNAQQSLLADVILTPLNMIALLLSLLLADEKARQWRLSQRSSGMNTPHWSVFSSARSPYEQPSELNRDSGTWYYRKTHRAVAKLELADALDMRGRVFVALLAWSAIMLCAVVYTLRQLYNWATL